MKSLMITGVIALSSCGAAAQVAEYSSFRTLYYSQPLADVQPAAEDSASLILNLRTFGPDDATQLTVTFPGPASPVNVPQVIPEIFQSFSGYLINQAELDAEYPSGTYTFAIDAGVLGSDTGDLAVPPPLFAEETPYLTFDTLDRLQDMDASVEFYGTMNGYTPVLTADENLIFVAIYPVCGGGDLLGGYFVDSSATDFVIPALTLEPSHQYIIAIYHSVRQVFSPGGFVNGAVGYVAFDKVTQSTFTTAFDGCLADLTGEGEVDFADFLEFFNAYDAADSAADLNGCDGVEFGDFLLFFNAYDTGCQPW